MSEGFIYCATGTKHIELARSSVKSLKKQYPGAYCILYSDTMVHGSLFDEIILLANPVFGYQDKILAMISSPMVKNVYLDTDTLILRNLKELFNLLDCFDLAVAFEPRRKPHSYEETIPDYFPHFNTGVVAFKKNNATVSFFNSWLDNYDLNSHQQDQPAFRRTLFESNLKFYILPTEYNFRGNTFDYACNAIHIYHDGQISSNKKFVQNAEKLLNSRIAERYWNPRKFKMVYVNDGFHQYLVRFSKKIFPKHIFVKLKKTFSRDNRF